MMKLTILAPRRPGLTAEAFRHYLVGVHGPLIVRTPAVADGIMRYHYNFPLPGPAQISGHPMTDAYGAITQVFFASRAALARNVAEPDYQTIIRPDEANFVDGANALMHCTHEIPITTGAWRSRKLFCLRRRRADIDPAAFQSEWRAAMTELVAESPAWRRTTPLYVQNHVLPARLSAIRDPRLFDLIDEIHLPDDVIAEDLLGALALKDLEADMLAPGSTRCLVTETYRNID